MEQEEISPCHRRRKNYYLNLSLDILDGIRWLNLEGDSFPGEGLHKDLHSALSLLCKFVEL